MPKLYVGTYAKYNSGSIKGAWPDLEDYSDKESFLEACKELHRDEADPELMFQDFEGFPKALYSESSVSDELFEWLELSEDDQRLLAVYLEHVDQSGTLEQARDSFHGTARNAADWAADFLEETGDLKEVPENLRNYIDYESYARDLRHSGFVFAEVDGEVWVFSPS